MPPVTQQPCTAHVLLTTKLENSQHGPIAFFKNALKGTMDATNATWPCKPVSAKGKVSTFALCLIPYLSICYKHHLGPGWPGSGLFGCPHTLQLACQLTHLQAGRASATKQNIQMDLCSSNLTTAPCYLLILQIAARRAHTGSTSTRLSDSRQTGLDPQPVKSELSFCNTKEQHVPKQSSIYTQLYHTQIKLRATVISIYIHLRGLFFSYKEITKILIETNV